MALRNRGSSSSGSVPLSESQPRAPPAAPAAALPAAGAAAGGAPPPPSGPAAAAAAARARHRASFPSPSSSSSSSASSPSAGDHAAPPSGGSQMRSAGPPAKTPPRGRAGGAATAGAPVSGPTTPACGAAGTPGEADMGPPSLMRRNQTSCGLIRPPWALAYCQQGPHRRWSVVMWRLHGRLESMPWVRPQLLHILGLPRSASRNALHPVASGHTPSITHPPASAAQPTSGSRQVGRPQPSSGPPTARPQRCKHGMATPAAVPAAPGRRTYLSIISLVGRMRPLWL